MPGVFIVGVVFGWVGEGFEVCWNVRGESFAADMLQVMRRFVCVAAVGRMLFMMTMMAIGAVHERLCNLDDAAEVNEEECADGQRASGRDRAGGCATEVRRMTPLQERDDFGDGDLAEQITEEDEKEKASRGTERTGRCVP